MAARTYTDVSADDEIRLSAIVEMLLEAGLYASADDFYATAVREELRRRGGTPKQTMRAWMERWGMSETEKITINLGVVDLGQIDLLVENGFYSNRTDFIRTAIRNQLDKHASDVKDTIERKKRDSDIHFMLGIGHYGKSDLEKLRAKGERVRLYVIGMLTIADDVPPELAAAVFERMHVQGSLRTSAAITRALIASGALDKKKRE